MSIHARAQEMWAYLYLSWATVQAEFSCWRINAQTQLVRKLCSDYSYNPLLRYGLFHGLFSIIEEVITLPLLTASMKLCYTFTTEHVLTHVQMR
eukprot:351879-Chlamydomonas_euryale.AAC.19